MIGFNDSFLHSQFQIDSSSRFEDNHKLPLFFSTYCDGEYRKIKTRKFHSAVSKIPI